MEQLSKEYYKIGEVSKLVGVRPHVLRYWESEFEVLRPEKTGSNQRLFRKRDVENVLRIRDLLYNNRYTIAGAKKKMRDVVGGFTGTAPTPDMRQDTIEFQKEKIESKREEITTKLQSLDKIAEVAKMRKTLLSVKKDLESLITDLETPN